MPYHKTPLLQSLVTNLFIYFYQAVKMQASELDFFWLNETFPHLTNFYT